MGAKGYPLISSFNGGEVSSLVEGRTDLEKYNTLLKKCENFLVTPQGAALNRSGLKYITGTKNNTSKSRLIPFRYSTDESYILEFSNQKIRILKGDGLVTTPDADTKLLLHMNGIDASTTFTDDSVTPHTVTANGNAQIDTAYKKFGTGSGLFDGTGDYLSIPDHADFDFSGGIFTVDVWIRPTAIGNTMYIYTQGNSSTYHTNLRIHSTGTLRFNVINTVSIISMTSTSTISANTWTHVAVVENGDSWYLFINGILEDSITDTDRTPNYIGDIIIGAFVDFGNGFDGHIDEFRVSNGTARWTADFIPPTIEYPAGDNSGTVVEVTTTYREDDLFDLQFAQSADVLYLAHKDFEPRKLIRLSETSWALQTISFFPPPLKTQTYDPNVACTLDLKTVGDSAGGVRTFTAGSAIFLAGDVGREIREKVGYGNGRALIKTYTDTTHVECDIFIAFSSTSLGAGEWEIVGTSTNSALTLGQSTIEIGDVFTATSASAYFLSGNVGSYIQASNAISGGTATIKMKIIAFTSATIVTVAAVEAVTFSDTSVAAGDWLIKNSVWNSTNKYPATVCFFENRLVWAGSTGFPQTIWASQVDDYENHLNADDGDAEAYQFTLAGRQVNTIQWMEDSLNLVIGTAGAVWALGLRGSSEPVTPSNVSAKSQSGYGSALIQSVKVGQTVIYLATDATELRELAYNFEDDRYVSDALGILHHTVLTGGAVQMDYQQKPYSVIWIVRNDGELIGLTFLKAHGVFAWQRITTGLSGEVESVAVIPASPEDEVWVVVKRTVNGSTKRFIERLTDTFTSSDLDDAFFMDAGVFYDGVSTTTITGLDHLDGESVNVVGDGLEQADKTVSSGSITIATAASKVSVGIGYTSTLQLLKLETSTDVGTAQGKTKKITSLGMRFYKTYNALIGASETDTDRIDFTAGELFTGDKIDVDYPEGYETDGYITVIQDKPFPLNLLAIMPNVDVEAI